MSDSTRSLVDEWNDGYMADLAVPEDVSEAEVENTPSGPEEMLERVETFLSIGFNANAKHHAKKFQSRYDVDIADLIEDVTRHLMVRFAKDGKAHPKQFGTINSIHDPIPDEASYGSSIYFLTGDERARTRSFKTGWEMEDGCIGKKLQDASEARDEVLYPVHIESDADVALPVQIAWIWALVDKYLPVSPRECWWYYSGGRSIHAHVPLFVRDDGREYMKDLVEDCPVDLDESIYQTKPQFRLPGAVHDEKGLPKTRIDPERRHDDPEEGHRAIVGEAVRADPQKPETYADLLRETFGPDVLDDPTKYLWEPDIGPYI